SSGLRVTMSVGLTARQQESTVKALLERADACLYRAKHLGRNRVVTCRERMSGSACPRRGSVLVVEDGLERHAKCPGETEGEFERRRVLLGLPRDDRLASRADPVREFRLRQAGGLAELPYPVGDVAPPARGRHVRYCQMMAACLTMWPANRPESSAKTSTGRDARSIRGKA